jgi:hypothetical protein
LHPLVTVSGKLTEGDLDGGFESDSSQPKRCTRDCGDWHTLKSLMSLRRAAVDILIYEIFDEKTLDLT